MQKILVGFVFVDFVALTLATLSYGMDGLTAFIEGGNIWTVTLVVDLLIALSIVCVWMWHDARKRGTSALPYILLTCTTGSVGPLLYILRRPETANADPGRLSSTAVPSEAQPRAL
ncbi:MAG: DUF2834 domain-containing protein [Myxococcota bacterium]